MSKIFIGNNRLNTRNKKVTGEIITINDEQYYKISNYDEMHPFFISVVSESDLWMYISSNGALTAGRKNADNALFPYYTDDRIHDSRDITGSKTLFKITRENKTYLWEPFSANYRGIYHCRLNIYKNRLGNKLIFEEINDDLGISFQYAWLNADPFGFIKKSQIINHNSENVYVEILDGIQNLLPSGIDRKFQLEYSTLVDGYKKNELLPEAKLGLYMLSSVPVDRAEPSESLTTTIAWSAGLNQATVLLSSTQLNAFRQGKILVQETDVRAERGAYFINAQIDLPPNQPARWYTVIDLNKTQTEVAELSQFILTTEDIETALEKSIQASSEALQLKIARADGIQLTDDKLNVFRHSANTMFNIMRGGLFDDGYRIDKKDFQQFLSTANKRVAEKYKPVLNKLPETIGFQELLTSVSQSDKIFNRLCNEYLPLSFSRRHGDPSRPWNRFSIDIKDKSGNKKLNYEGNWRDIFQNWEALAFSFPEYIESMITKFVNASTADGYNPYRVVRNGFDWEVLDPNDAWSYIGYWGDHQIIYLQKLLELSDKYHPGKLQQMLVKDIFTYANVPYKIKTYDEIYRDPYNTVDFDSELNKAIAEKVEIMGADAKYVFGPDGNIYTVTLAEKLLVPALVKLSNFVPEAGIWMNTQRPEWNDANNALVGNGTSMVTLYYVRRYVNFIKSLFGDVTDVEISDEVYRLLSDITETFNKFQHLLSGKISDKDRKTIVYQLSLSGTRHRQSIYGRGFSGKHRAVKSNEFTDFFKITLKFIDHSIQANERDDHLFHAYNLISLKKDEISIRYLYEMLEGQVAVLSAGYLDTGQTLTLLKSLRNSRLYRKDQNSYMLYPNRQLARFTEKNVIPENLIKKSSIIAQWLTQKDTDIVEIDIHGDVHFHSSFRNARVLKQALIEKNIGNDVRREILDIYEAVFDHQSFTGRSGTFYKYEGLGSIYWHMVSKLLLAVQENYFKAVNSGADRVQIDELKQIYYDIRKGIGSHKSPKDYGAFPTDPYSHTPGHRGVQQPGMTGQVKEDLISRLGELGVCIEDGCIRFAPILLKKSEFLRSTQEFTYYNVSGKKNIVKLNPGSLAFTVVQVPVIYHLSDTDKVKIFYTDNNVETFPGHRLGPDVSKSIFKRSDDVLRIEVSIKNSG
ncbi:MAG: hypothetical protein DRP96_01265 [Candidatus Neomarinimicrobiota bacterium]|nr:MAG: hypothetical protein DRP96_01265 [Candidatus Neomarinimicrobiota bacterium]